MWLFSGVHWDLCLWEGCTASTKCPLSWGTASPHVAQGPHFLLLGVCPSHQSSARYQAEEFQTLCSPVHSLMVSKHSPFSFLTFLLSPLWVFLLSFSPAVFRGKCFSCASPTPISNLSPQAKTAPYPLRVLSPPVYLFMPHTCRVLWFKLCRLLC